jgi:hypothetical protein
MADPPVTPATQAEQDPPPQGRMSRFFIPLGQMTENDERVALIIKAALVAVLFTWGKWVVHNLGWAFIDNVPLVTALLGGVSFTLAILLNATLVDYKESERIVGELVSAVRRLHWDLPMIRQDAALLTRADQEILAFVKTLRQDLRKGFSIKLSRIYPIIESIDRTVVHLAEAGGRLPVARTVQVGIGTIVRIVDRLEVIMETSFTRTGYTFAGVVTFGSLAILGFTRFGAINQALVLFGFAVFLLAGLFLLIWDLDNPFSGHARVNPYQLDKLEAYLKDHIGASHTPPA